MKSYWKAGAAVLVAACALGLITQVSSAQQSGNAPNAGGNPVANTNPTQASQAGGQAHATAGEPAFYILAEFTQSLNAKKLKAGEKINARVTQDVLSHGRIIIPSESRLMGHVTEVKCHDALGQESRLGLVFDKVLLKHKREVDFRGVLHALSAPADRPSLADQPDQMLSPSAMGLVRGSSGAPIGASWIQGQLSANGAGAMSVGMPLGVFGLKGLALLPGTTGKTPGPVIRSRADNIKLESGTQVLLRVTDVTVPRP